MIFFIFEKDVKLETHGHCQTYLGVKDFQGNDIPSEQIYCTSLGEFDRMAERLKAQDVRVRLLPENQVRACGHFPQEIGVSNIGEQQRLRKRQWGPLDAVNIAEQIQALPKKNLRLAVLNGFGSSLGDSVIGIGAFRQVYALFGEQGRQVEIDICLRTDAIDRLSQQYLQFPEFRQVRPMPISLAALCAYDLLLDCSGIIYRYDAHGLVPMTDFYLYSFGLDPARIANAEKRNLILLDAEARAEVAPKLAALREQGPLLLFHPQTSTAARSIPESEQPRFLRALLENTDYQIVCLTEQKFQHPRVHDLSAASKSFAHFCALVVGMDALLCADTVVYHIADAFQVPGLALFSTIEPELRVPYYPSVQGLLLDGASETPHFRSHQTRKDVPLDSVLALWRKLSSETILQNLQNVLALHRKNPYYPLRPYQQLATALLQQGKPEAAKRAYQQACEFCEPCPAYLIYGKFLQNQGDNPGAIAAYQQALEHSDSDEMRILALGQLGLVYKAQGEYAQAQDLLHAVLKIAPEHAIALGNLGNLYHQLEEFDAAQQCFEKVLRKVPDSAEAHNGLGLVAMAHNQPEQAIAHLQRAIACEPPLVEAFSNLGTAWMALNQDAKALFYYEQALKRRPQYHGARLNQALAKLKTGDLAGGLADYEARRLKNPTHYLPTNKPRWDGRPLQGKRLLVYWEQGFGDNIQFARFLRLIEHAYVIFMCRAELMSLFAYCPGIDRLQPADEKQRLLPDDEFDTWLPLLSLPHVLGIRDWAQLPASTPYLFPEPQRREAWAEKFAGEAYRIGLVWTGNPRHHNQMNRHCPPQLLEQLQQAAPKAKFYSLQYPTNPDLPAWIEDLAADFKDFGDTAAVIANLDLVICVDTSVAHLAGALGCPTWLMLPFAPDWRWLLEREDSPWYPSMRLFRQPERGDWAGLLAQVANALQNQRPAQRELDFARAYELQQQCFKDQQHAESIAHAYWALAFQPTHRYVLNLLSLSLSKSPQTLAAANAWSRYALRLHPQAGELMNNHGALLEQQNRHQEALNCYQIALTLSPEKQQIEYNIALELLRVGDFAAAWPHHEYRHLLGHSVPALEDTYPKWDGQPLNGKRLLVHFEQGYGDCIQFLRFVPYLRQQHRGVVVIVAVPRALLPLMHETPAVDEWIVGHLKKVPPLSFDYWIPLLSLPRIFKITLDNLPAPQAYLFPPVSRLRHWQQRIQAPGFRVGIVWAGNPKHGNDHNRSCPVRYFQALGELPGVTLFSLQKDIRADFCEDLGAEFESFADTAAAISCMDLVISVDTSVVHLAGALGCPAWVLLPFVVDWRWMQEREDSPWYPSLRLFRQPRLNAWDAVMEQLRAALLPLVKASQNRHFSELASANYQAGNQAIAQADWQTAARSYQQVLLECPRHEISLNNLGGAWWNLQAHEAALLCHNKLLRLQPNNAETWYHRGLALSRLDAPAEALACYQQAALLSNTHVKCRLDGIRLLRQRKDWQTALAWAQQACQQMPDEPSLQFELARVHLVLTDFARAQALLEAYCQVQPKDAAGWQALGQAYAMQQQTEAAEQAYTQALALANEALQVDIWSERMEIAQQQGQYETALALCERARAQLPEVIRLQHRQGLLQLQTERWAAGWEAYESRILLNNKLPDILLKQRWDGRPLLGETLLVHWEQGFGDMLQFVRYLPLAKQRVGRLVFACQKALLPLLKDNLAGVDEVIASDGKHWPNGYTHWAFLLSLPHLLQHPLPFDKTPYLRAPKTAVDALPALEKDHLRVGLVWSGSPTQIRNVQRSLDLSAFAPFARHQEIEFISLQLGNAGQQTPPPGLRFTPAPNLADFAATAAWLTQLDLLITVDTSVAHLAAALGRPVWVLGSWALDWRWWGTEPEHSAWYQSARIFRQPQANDWESVIAAVDAALEIWKSEQQARDHADEDLPIAAKKLANKASQAHRERELAQAKKLYQQALALAPEHTDLLYQCGNMSLLLEQFEDAESYYQRTLAQQPQHWGALNNIAGLWQKHKRLDEALAVNTQLLGLQPLDGNVWNNRGFILQQLDELEEAYCCGRYAQQWRPDNALGWVNFGKTCKDLNRLDEALECFRQAIALQPDYVDAQQGAAGLLEAHNEPAQALALYRDTLQIEPENALAHVNLGIALLKTEQFAEGWQEYEWRFLSKSAQLEAFTKPRWEGEPLQDKHLLVQWEQGFGDTIQFLRYLPMIKAAKVTLAVQGLLLDLLHDCPGATQVIGRNKTEPDFAYDYWIPLLSLARIFATRADNIPPPLPPQGWLQPEEAAIAPWRARLTEAKQQVGIVWAGNPQHTNDRNRSCDPRLFKVLAELPELALYSLQKPQSPPADLAQIADWGKDLNNFTDTAAAIMALDLVICVDTSVAHLAASLGRPVWLLLPFAPDWRWQLERSDSPWYPSMRLFRQPKPGDWQPVFTALTEALNSLIRTGSHL